MLAWFAHNVWLMLNRRWYRFGYACLNFGPPLSMRAYARDRKVDFRTKEPDAGQAALQVLGEELLEAVARCIPVTPVAIVASVFVRNPTEAMSELEVKARAQRLVEGLERHHAYVHIPRADRDYAVTVGLRMLTLTPLGDEIGRALPGQRRRHGTPRLLRQFHRAFPRRAARDERQRLTGSSVTDGACASLRNKTSGLRVGPVSMPWANACSKGSPALAPGGGRLRSAALSAGLVTARLMGSERVRRHPHRRA